jgi:hypothetical protein
MRKTRLKLLVIFFFLFAGALVLMFAIASNDSAYKLDSSTPNGESDSKPAPQQQP